MNNLYVKDIVYHPSYKKGIVVELREEDCLINFDCGEIWCLNEELKIIQPSKVGEEIGIQSLVLLSE